MRKFNIKIGQKVIIENLDIFEKVGGNSTYDEYIEISIKGDEIFHNN